MHTALSAALWVLSVHNMAAIILLAAAEAWGQATGGRGGVWWGEGAKKGVKKLASNKGGTVNGRRGGSNPGSRY